MNSKTFSLILIVMWLIAGTITIATNVEGKVSVVSYACIFICYIVTQICSLWED